MAALFPAAATKSMIMGYMKRPYTVLKLTKYQSALDPEVTHDLMNLTQVITAQCEMLEATPPAAIKKHVTAIQGAAFELRNRLVGINKSA